MRWLQSNANASLGLPWVVKAEFLAGAVIAGHSPDRVTHFLADYLVLWPDEETVLTYARGYAELRKQKLNVGTNDLWIAAAALVRRVPLVTKNAAELSRVAGLQVVDYTKV